MPSGPSKQPRVSLTVRLPRELADRLRTLAKDYSGKPWYLSVGGIVTDAVTSQIAQLERQIADHEHGSGPDLRSRHLSDNHSEPHA